MAGSHALHVLKGNIRFDISIDFGGGFSDAKEKLLKELAVSVAARI